MTRDVYVGRVRLNGEEHKDTIIAANNYAASLGDLERVKEAKELMRNTMLVARRVLGESHNTTLTMHLNYALALYKDASATLDDLREAVATLEDMERIARRVFGGEHPLTSALGNELLRAQAALHAARETTPGSS